MLISSVFRWNTSIPINPSRQLSCKNTDLSNGKPQKAVPILKKNLKISNTEKWKMIFNKVHKKTPKNIPK